MCFFKSFSWLSANARPWGRAIDVPSWVGRASTFVVSCLVLVEVDVVGDAHTRTGPDFEAIFQYLLSV